jgi:hypothetical protein
MRQRSKPMKKPSPLAERALELLQKTRKLRKPVLVHSAHVVDPATGETVHEFVGVSSADPNGPSYRVILGADGSPRKHVPGPDALTLASRPISVGRPVLAAPVTIEPAVNVLTLNPSDTLEETITVTIPKNAGTPKADIYFLADTTGSMGGVLAAVQAGANNILTTLNGMGLDLMFGVGNYKDFPPAAPSPFTHQLSPTNIAASITAAIGAWTATGGGDIPEGQLLALDRLAEPPGGAIGWRAGAKRIIVWFGDAPGHDAICTAITGLPPITEASVTAKLVAEQIVVLAISTATPGLDDNPVPISTDYTGTCGAPGGAAGQGTRLATATGGAFVTGINPATIVTTIISLVTAAVSGINNVKLVPSATIAPFIVSITPAGGFGPLSGDVEHVLKFEVKFRGIPCRDKDQVVSGTLDVVADGVVVASKKVQITVPACAPRTVRYSVKFVCGVQEEGCGCDPVRPGRYATHISIHNHSSETVEVRKRVIPVVLAGAPVGREPRVAKARAEDAVKLPPHTATMDDCCRITELLFGAPVDGLNIGLLEIIASRDVSVTAVYTTDTSLDVTPVEGRAV